MLWHLNTIPAYMRFGLHQKLKSKRKRKTLLLSKFKRK